MDNVLDLTYIHFIHLMFAFDTAFMKNVKMAHEKSPIYAIQNQSMERFRKVLISVSAVRSIFIFHNQ
jgi:magnesium-transporting ATPase (P-type)